MRVGSVISAITRLFDSLLKMGAALAGLLMIVIMMAVCVKILMRYGLGRGLVGVDQMSGSMLLFVTFLGAAWVLSREEHVTIDILYGNLAWGVQRWLAVVNSLICALVCGVILVFGTMEVYSSWQRGIRVAAELEIPRSATLFIIPLGSLLLMIQFLRRAWSSARHGPPTRRSETEAV